MKRGRGNYVAKLADTRLVVTKRDKIGGRIVPFTVVRTYLEI